MNKRCNKCNSDKELTEFYKNDNYKDGYMSHCKQCHSDYYKSRNQDSNGDNLFYVYYLPEHHYVGMTRNIDTRIYQHGINHNRITDGYEIVGIYNTAIEAHYIETILHLFGYKGFRGH